MTQLISNNYVKKTSFVLLKSYQILLNLYQKLMNLYQILMNLYQFLMDLYQILMNKCQFLTNYVISKKKRKKNGYFIEIISNYRDNTTRWNHNPWLENSSRDVHVLSCWVWTCFVVLTWIICCWSVDVDSILSVRTG